MESKSKVTEKEMIEALARDYKRKRYVVTYPSLSNGAVTIDGSKYVPDLIASKNGKHLIIEFKAKPSSNDRVYFDKIRQKISEKNGYQFLLHYGQQETPVKSHEFKVLDRKFKDAKKLIESGQRDAALLMLYALIEAKLWKLFGEPERPEGRSMFAVNWPKQARYLGLVSERDYEKISNIRSVRNRVAHGDFARVSKSDLDFLLRTYKALPSDTSAAKRSAAND